MPIKESQCDCDMWVDNIHAKAYVRVQMQLEYDKNNEKLKNYFKNLFSQDSAKIVDLKINIGAFKEIYDRKSNNEDFIIRLKEVFKPYYEDSIKRDYEKLYILNDHKTLEDCLLEDNIYLEIK